MAEMEVFDENEEIEYINDTGTAFIYATVPTGETEVGVCGIGALLSGLAPSTMHGATFPESWGRSDDFY